MADYDEAHALLDREATRISKKGNPAWWLPDHGLVINSPLFGGFNLWIWSILKTFPKRGSYLPAEEDQYGTYPEGIVIRPMWQPHPRYRNDAFPETVEVVEALLKFAKQTPTVQNLTRSGFQWIEKENGISIPSSITTKYVSQAPKVAARRWGVNRVRMADTFVPFDGSKPVPMPSFGRPAAKAASTQEIIMPTTPLRRGLIRLASAMPRGSRERQEVLFLLTNDGTRTAASRASTPLEREIRKAADDLIRMGTGADGTIRLVNEDEWFGGYGGSDPENPYLTFRFERPVPAIKGAKPFFVDVYVRQKNGKVYFIVDPYGTKAVVTSAKAAWEAADKVLWPIAHPEPFGLIAAKLFADWERKYGKVPVKKSGTSWNWSLTPDEMRERGMDTGVQNNPTLNPNLWHHDRATHYYRPDPSIRYSTSGVGLGAPGARYYWSVSVGGDAPRSVDTYGIGHRR